MGSNESGAVWQLNKDVKEFLSEVIDTLKPLTLDGKVIVLHNGHLKVKGKYASGTRSFVMGYRC